MQGTFDNRAKDAGAADAAYRATCMRLGGVFVLFAVLFIALQALADAVLSPYLARMSAEGEVLAEGLVSGAAYLLSFLLPAWVLWLLTPRKERLPLLLEPRLPKRTAQVLLAGMAVIGASTVTNNFLMRFLGLASDGSTVYWVDGMPLYEVVLLFLTSVLIPVFCEELLFRGVVLSVLRPYGKTVAVFGSAVLFGLMHQDASQLLYATVAGALLAYITLESRSIWGAVLLHALNNSLSALRVYLLETLDSGTAATVFAIAEILLVGLGLCCLALLLRGWRGEESSGEERCLPRRPVRDFLTWPMIVFVAISGAQMVLLIWIDRMG